MIGKLLIWLRLQKPKPDPLKHMDGGELGRKWMEGEITNREYWNEIYRRAGLGKRG